MLVLVRFSAVPSPSGEHGTGWGTLSRRGIRRVQLVLASCRHPSCENCGDGGSTRLIHDARGEERFSGSIRFHHPNVSYLIVD